MDEGGSESWGPASLSTKQLVYIAADIQKLQEQVHTQNNAFIYVICCAHWTYWVNISLNYALITQNVPTENSKIIKFFSSLTVDSCFSQIPELSEMVRQRLQAIGFQNIAVVEGKMLPQCIEIFKLFTFSAVIATFYSAMIQN